MCLIVKLGQRYKGRGRISPLADYVQLDISGLSAIEIVQNYFMLEIDKPIILLGDRTEKGYYSSEDHMLSPERMYEIKDAISSLQAFGAEILAITFSPVSRVGLKSLGSKITYSEFVDKLNEIYQIPVLVRNVSNKDLYLSTPEEVVEFSKIHKLTIDSFALLEACDNSVEKYLDTISKIDIRNVQEIHVYSIGMSTKSFVGNEKLNHGVDMSVLMEYVKKIPLATFMLTESGGTGSEFEKVVSGIFDSLK